MPKPSKTDTSKIDLEEVLKQRPQVAVIWSAEDVQSVRSDLNDDQAWKVLVQCKRAHDCNEGINWLLIETVADALFPTTSDE